MVLIIATVVRQIFVIFFYRGFRLVYPLCVMYVLCMNYDCKIKKFTKMNSGCILL